MGYDPQTHRSIAIIGGIFAILAAIIGGIFLLVNTFLEKTITPVMVITQVVPITVTSPQVSEPPVLPINEKSVTIYSNSSDGELANIICNNWDSCRTASESVNVWDTYNEGTIGASWYSSGYEVKRVFLFFNTKSIPSNAVIKSATLNFYAGEGQVGNTIIHVVSSTAGEPLSYPDFLKVDLVSGGTVRVSPNRWTTIEFNANALDWIIKNESTALSLIHDKDIGNSIPNTVNNVVIVLSDDTQHRPYLVITYAVP